MYTLLSKSQRQVFTENLRLYAKNTGYILFLEGIPNSCMKPYSIPEIRYNIRWLRDFLEKFDLTPKIVNGQRIIIKKRFNSPFEIPPISWLEYLDISQQILNSFEKVHGNRKTNANEIGTNLTPRESQAIKTGIPLVYLNPISRNAALSLFSYSVTNFSAVDFLQITKYKYSDLRITTDRNVISLNLNNQPMPFSIGKYLRTKINLDYDYICILHFANEHDFRVSEKVANKPLAVFGDYSKTDVILGLRDLYNIKLHRRNGVDIYDTAKIPQPSSIDEYIKFLTLIFPESFKLYFESKSNYQYQSEYSNQNQHFFNLILSQQLLERKLLSLPINFFNGFEKSLTGFILCSGMFQRMIDLARKLKNISLQDLIVSVNHQNANFVTIQINFNRNGKTYNLYEITTRTSPMR